jgi:hypothetical protein
MEAELYDYSTQGGRLELENVSKSQPKLYEQLTSSLFNNAIGLELRKPLPTEELIIAQQQALKEYLNFVTRLTQLRSKLGSTDEILQLSRAMPLATIFDGIADL